MTTSDAVTRFDPQVMFVDSPALQETGMDVGRSAGWSHILTADAIEPRESISDTTNNKYIFGEQKYLLMAKEVMRSVKDWKKIDA